MGVHGEGPPKHDLCYLFSCRMVPIAKKFGLVISQY